MAVGKVTGPVKRKDAKMAKLREENQDLETAMAVRPPKSR